MSKQWINPDGSLCAEVIDTGTVLLRIDQDGLTAEAAYTALEVRAFARFLLAATEKRRPPRTRD